MTEPAVVVTWLDRVQRLDGLCDRLNMCAVALHGAKPEDRHILGSIVVELRGITLELECLRNSPKEES